ncbi:MAG: hypothetical protein ABSG76_19110 [Xanthobacteraceae bacterium]|jgi:hypothetical protein
MASGTVGAHLDKATMERVRATAAVENRAISQIQAVALKALLDLSPGARRALFAIDGIADDAERQFAAKAIGRAALLAYERIIDARHQQEHHTNHELDTEEAIDAEAARLCRP